MTIQLGYAIEGFQVMPGLGPARYGFTINLRGDVARAVAKADKRDEKSPVFLELKTILRDSSHQADRGFTRVDFYKDTWLLRSIHAGGSCACFGIDGNDLFDIEEKNNPYVRYGPHNIDTPQQAGAILSTWLHWFNCLVALTDFQLP